MIRVKKGSAKLFHICFLNFFMHRKSIRQPNKHKTIPPIVLSFLNKRKLIRKNIPIKAVKNSSISIIRKMRRGLGTLLLLLASNPLTYVSMPAEFLYNLTKNLTAHLQHNLCAVLPIEFLRNSNAACQINIT